MIYIGPRTKMVAITHMSNADAGSGRPAANAGIRRPRYLKVPLDASENHAAISASSLRRRATTDRYRQGQNCDLFQVNMQKIG
jgi:hypothetical protein